MAKIIDFHTHVFADWLKDLFSQKPLEALSQFNPLSQLNVLRKTARNWAKPFSGSIHGLQTHLRYLPDSVRKGFDEMAGIIPLPGLLVQSTVDDILEEMQEAGVDQAVVIAHPPFIQNDFVIEICQKHSELIPVVNIPKGTPKPGATLKKYIELGARALKIHAAADGEDLNSARYRALLKTAASHHLPVILHTGCIHSHLLYRSPEHAKAEAFIPWFKAYPEIRFVLAHMNFHEPTLALDLCEDHPNLYVDTSWQPTEIIGEAVRRIGAERVLFGTDWPLVGNNMGVGRKRIQDGIESGLLNPEQAQLILGVNAIKLLGLETHAN